MNCSIYVSSVLLASVSLVSQQNFPYDVIFLSICSVLTVGHIAGSQWSENTVEVTMEVEEIEWAEADRPVAMSDHQIAPFPQ
jgi:hypothetical protein